MIGKLACGDWIAANMLLKSFADLVHYFKERAGVVSSHQKEVIDLLSRSMHEWRRGFRTIGKLTCRDQIAANTLLKRFGDLVHYFEERAGVVSSHQKEVIDLLSRSMNKWRRGFQTIGELTCQDWIAANTLLKRFGDLVHYFEERAGVVSLH